MAEQDSSSNRNRPRASRPQTTAYGLFGFAGLLLGATIGGFVFYSPGVGALGGAALGFLAAYLQARRS